MCDILLVIIEGIWGNEKLYKVIFYEDKRGYSQVYEFIKELVNGDSKDARINAAKVNDYIQALAEYGTYVGMPVCRHLEDNIWELRPLNNRILFAGLSESRFILLHQFVKKTKKTPKKEIEKAKREFADYMERNTENEGME